MPKVIKSLRVEPELWASVEGFAKTRKIDTTAAAVLLITRGLGAKEPPVSISEGDSPLRFPKSPPGQRLKAKVGPSKWVLFK